MYKRQEVSCHYVDSVGFVELPGFFSGKNHLRSAEDSLEQNDNSLDGVINNLPDGQTGRSSSEERHSVLEQLKSLQPTERAMAPYQPVSYTHLDVYKRQTPRWGLSQPMAEI